MEETRAVEDRREERVLIKANGTLLANINLYFMLK